MSQYASIADLYRYGFRQEAGGDLADEVLTAALVAASTTVDGHLAQRFGAPLTSWPQEVTIWVCKLAAFEIMTGPRGISSESADYVVLKDRRDEAMSLLRRTQGQDYTPYGLAVATGPGVAGTQPLVISSTARGW